MTFQIKRIAELSGFDPALLRAWERRYDLLRPERLENGYRLYTQSDLAVLRRIRTLLDRGRTIGDIARIGRDALLASEEAGGALAAAEVEPADAETYWRSPHPELGWRILDALPWAIILTDTEGLVRWVNRGVPALCGYDLAEMNGQNPGRMLQGPATEKSAVRTLRNAIAAQTRASVHITNYHKNGEPYFAELEVTPLFAGLTHVGFLGTARRLDETPARRPRTTSRSR